MNFIRCVKTLCFVSVGFVLLSMISLVNYNNSSKTPQEITTTARTKRTDHHPQWSSVHICRATISQQNKTRRTLWSKGYKNPCFRHRHKKQAHGEQAEMTSFLQCVPYFFVAGFPKCGTTDLFDRMTGHPEFFRPSFKEIHWLTRYRFVQPRQLRQFQIYHRKYRTRGLDYGFRQYTRIFDNIAVQLERLPKVTNLTERQTVLNGITGDFSPSTVWDNDFFSFLPENEHLGIPRYTSADFVKEMNPCAKVIILLRDPVNRLYSDYLFFPTSHQDPHDFHTKVLKSVTSFQDCLETKDVRHCVFDVIRNKAMPVRIRLGMYYVYIEEWFKRFPKEQILILRLEDYANNMPNVLRKVFEFLEMSPLPDDKLKEISQWSPVNSRPTDAPPMLESTKELLTEFYKTFNIELATLLDDQRFLWEKAV